MEPYRLLVGEIPRVTIMKMRTLLIIVWTLFMSANATAQSQSMDNFEGQVSFRIPRTAMTVDLALVNRSNEPELIPGDVDFDYADKTRSYGLVMNTSIQITRDLSLMSGITRVTNDLYRD